MAAYLPEIKAGTGKVALDLGCGSAGTAGNTQKDLASYGYRWVGVDMAIGRASVLGDGHCLPFKARAFDLVVSVAAIEHMRKPWVVARELGRIARPGALFLGTTAFLEPEHDRSYYHMSHLGIHSFLEEAGFEPLALWPGWTVQEAMAWFTFIAGGGKKRHLHRPFRWILRLLELVMRSIRLRRTWSPEGRVVDQLRFSGSIGFAAQKNQGLADG